MSWRKTAVLIMVTAIVLMSENYRIGMKTVFAYSDYDESYSTEYDIEIYEKTSQDGKWIYNVLDDGTVEVVEYMGSTSKFTIPAEIDGLLIAKISTYIFQREETVHTIEVSEENQYYSSENGVLYDKNKTTLIVCPNGKEGVVEIPEGVTSICENAFLECSKISSVIIPSTVTNIGEWAFSDCYNLNSIKIPEGVTSIEQNTFNNCVKLAGVLIPDSVMSIGDYAFSGCANLRSVTIPKAVTSIGRVAFQGCKTIQTIVIPDGVTRIEDYTFNDCGNLKNITIPNSVTSIGDYAIPKLNSLIIYASMGTYAHTYAIENEISWKDVDNSTEDEEQVWGNWKYDFLPNGTITLTEYFGTDTDVIIPEEIDGITVSEIGVRLFSDHTELKNVNLPSGIISIEAYAFYNCSSLNSITIPESVTNIGNSVFSGCSSLKNIQIPDGITELKFSIFANCTNLKSIVLPKSLEIIDVGVFSGCTRLSEITIPETVTMIGAAAFSECTSMENIIIPKGVMYIRNGAFNYTGNLCNIIVSNDNPYFSSKDGILYNKDKTSLILCPRGKTGVFEIPKGVTTIEEEAFAKCKLSKVIIPDSVTSISSNQAFSSNSNITIYSSASSCARTYAESQGIHWECTDKLAIDSISLKSSIYTYNGYAKKPTVTVKTGSKTLVNGNDYTVTYSNNINPGTAKITVTGKGAYTGTLTKTFTITPAKVKNFKQSTTYATTKITMSWTKVPGVTGYAVYRANSKNGTYKYLKTTTTNSCANAGLKAGIKYYYKVRAYKTVDGKKIYGAFSEAKSMLTKPAAPTKFSVTADRTTAKLTWEKVSSGNGYEIYMANSRNGSYSKVKNTTYSATFYSKTGLTKGKRYYFKMRAYKITGTGAKVYSGYSSIKAVTIK